ncbi:hypothetical protein [Roseiconus lacunae]|uniref:Type II secretion system protein GspE N-terminal domain-containing protein n=1 Tax=Roseiconus lacunae TaxID=2605694 RepID=A0ABT7PR15_9BACT|nr:hypothetical protein [Roseiconus lacunae]MDM4018955.1 hypothetical protein [Roseiconus lacunae]
MRHNQKSLDAVPVDPLALELVPQSVAEELCVLAIGFDGETLKLILPADFDAETGRTLRFILDRNFTADHADRSLLSTLIDHYYAASCSDITNCDSRLRFDCPKQWANLSPTDRRDVRRCQSCQRLVYFCYTQTELDQQRNAGECVAFCDPDTYGTFLGMPE